MQDHPETLDGPDFLDAIADAEAANGKDINAAEFRRRARQWRDDKLTLHRAADTVADLQGRLNAIGQPAMTVGTRFTDNGDGTVTDHRTGLMWSKDDVVDERVDWAKADAACQALVLGGHDDWRLPTRADLLTLVDDTRHEPAIDTAAFPTCKSNWYWTATPCAWAPSCAWFVFFDLGYADSYHRDCSLAFARAVRAVPAGQ